MVDRNSLIKLLVQQNIKYKLFLHDAIFTVEDSKKMRNEISGAHTKNLFLKNKKNKFFLFSCLENTSIDLKVLQKKLGLGNLSFASEKYLIEMLKLKPGSVTPFGLLNDINNKITFFLDENLINYKFINFHPLENTATINIETNIFINFMKQNNKLVKFINFDNYLIKDE